MNGTESEGGVGEGESHVTTLAGLEGLLAALYEGSGAAQFDMPASRFSHILSEIAEKYLPADAGPAAVRELLSKLQVQDLALARACAAGHSRAWEIFLLRYRECLYQAAKSITKDEGLGRELADSLYADLYSSGSRGAQRTSRLDSYTGAGSLAGWLHTLLAHTCVDRYRREHRFVPLDEQEEDDPRLTVPPAEAAFCVDPRLENATDEALASLSPSDGFVLVSYFLDGQTLADIARTLKLHESTVCRRVEKLTAGLRKRIRDAMQRRGMSRAQAEEALQTDVRDLQVNVSARLQESLQENRTRSFSRQRAAGSAPGGT